MSAQLPSLIHFPWPGPLKRTHFLIFFMPGNPGLVEYYRPFLERVRDQLSASAALAARDASFEIYARSFSGFETSAAELADEEQQRRRRRGRGGKDGPGAPFSLEEQLVHCEARLHEA
ncbi:MAG: hypothetical protein INR71_04760, partial [Terriglobus roseus]|nr:hypothetical protein [Terriglobus roseus]